MKDPAQLLRRAALVVGAAAVIGVGWGAYRVLQAQTTGSNLLDNLHLLVVAGLGAVSLTILGTRGDAVLLPARSPRAEGRRGKAPANLLLVPTNGLPLRLDRPVIQLGSGPGAHVTVEGAARAARIEARAGRLWLVPLAAGWALNGAAVQDPAALEEGDVLRFGPWTASVRGQG